MRPNLRRTIKLETHRYPTFNLWNGLSPEDNMSPNFDFYTPTNDLIDLVEVSVEGLEMVVSLADELGFNKHEVSKMQADIDWARQRQLEYITFCYY